MLDTFGLLISVWFLPDPYCIRQIPYFLYWYIYSVLHCAGNVFGRVPVDFTWSMAKYSNCAMCEQGRGRAGSYSWGGGIAWVCAQNYYGAQFIAPKAGHILGPSPVPVPVDEWRDEIWGSCWSTTLWPQLRSGCWTNHICLKGVPRVFYHELTQICEYN